jgi:hypothetical protein
MVEIDDIVYRRFPNRGYAPIEECFALCERAGHVVLSMRDVAQLRARHKERSHPTWIEIQRVYSGSVVGVGLLDGLPTVVVAHAKHPLMTASAIQNFKSDPQRFDRGGIRLSKDEVQGLILPYSDSQRDIFVYQHSQLANPQVLHSKIVPATIDATARTLLVSMIGNEDVESYLQGHRNNFGDEIGIFFDRAALNSEGLLFRPLWFGNRDFNSLKGYDGRFNVGCVFGVPCGAAGDKILPALDSMLLRS